MSERRLTFFEALCEELEFRALNAKSKEAREALQSAKHAIEDVLARDGRGCSKWPLIRCGEGGSSVTADCSSPDRPLAASLAYLRAEGWRVAAHNDYALDGQFMTFWLFTNPQNGRFVKGEGKTDAEALTYCEESIERLRGGYAADALRRQGSGA